MLRLTNDGAFNREPGWSPDGTKIAWTRRGDGNDEVYMMNAGGSGRTDEPHQQSRRGLASDLVADGTQIAFASGRDGGNERLPHERRRLAGG